MIRNLFHPLLLVPTLLLVLLIGVNVAIEVNIDDYREEIVNVLADKSSALNEKLHDTLWDLGQIVDTVHGSDQLAATQPALDSKKQALKESLDHVVAYHNEHPEWWTLYGVDPVLLAIIQDDFDIFSRQMAEASREDFTVFHGDMHALLERMYADVHLFMDRARDGREAVIQKLVAQLGQEEVLRESITIIAVFIFAGLFILALRGMRRYQNESERAKYAERRYGLFAAVIHSTRIGVMIRDLQRPETPVIFVNKAFTDLTGYDLNDLVGKPVGFLAGLHTDSTAALELRRAFDKGETTTIEMLIYRKDNRPFWSEWSIGPVRQNDGRVTHYFSLISDVSEFRSTQESMMLAKEEAERAGLVKSNFLATMSHELRTPINGVLGLLDLLKDSRLDDEQSKLLHLAQNSGRHLLDIVNDILDFSKIEAGKLELDQKDFSLRRMVREVQELMQPAAEGKNLSLTVTVEEDTPDRVLSDEGRIRQILLNLVSNALKFTDAGSVDVRVFSLMDQTDAVNHLALIRFEVTDTGIGISVADQEKLFSEFSQIDRSFTRRFGGTGLGLAITKQLVKLLNGEVGVESRPEHGSKFWFMLPLQRVLNDVATVVAHEARLERGPLLPPVLSTEALAVPPPVPSPNAAYEILLVEDNQVNQIVTRRYLQKAGFLSELASNGQEALTKVQSKRYDLILMDISMPIMDGLTATRAIRALGGVYSDIPIVAVTAHVMRGDREQCIAAGMNDYLCKPLHYETLCKVLVRWLPKAVIPIVNAPLPEPSVTDAPQTQPVYDPSALEHLVADLDSGMVMHITQVFLDDFAKRVVRLKEKISFSEPRDVARECHALKSSCAGCGLMRFSDLMRQIEAAANKGDEDTIQTLSDQIDSLYDASCKALVEGRKLYEPR